jgi:hypothetical protein
VRYRGLQGIKTVVERQECVLAEGDDDRLVLDRKHCRLRVLRSGLQISDGAALFPLGDGLGIDAVPPGKAPQALLTMLYRSTERLCRCGAAVKNLSHSASLKFPGKGAPSNPGIKHTQKKVARRKVTLLELAGNSATSARPAASSATAASSSTRSAATSRPTAPTACSTGSLARATHTPTGSARTSRRRSSTIAWPTPVTAPCGSPVN